MNHDLDKVEMLGRLGGRLPLEDKGLGEEHPGDADEGRQEEGALDEMLPGVHVLVTLGAVLLILLQAEKKQDQRVYFCLSSQSI